MEMSVYESCKASLSGGAQRGADAWDTRMSVFFNDRRLLRIR